MSEVQQWIHRRKLLGKRAESEYRTIIGRPLTESEILILNDMRDLLDTWDEMAAELNRLYGKYVIGNRELTSAEIERGLALEATAAKYVPTQPDAGEGV